MTRAIFGRPWHGVRPLTFFFFAPVSSGVQISTITGFFDAISAASKSAFSVSLFLSRNSPQK